MYLGIFVDLTGKRRIMLLDAVIGAVMDGPMAVSAMGFGEGRCPVVGVGDAGDERGPTAERRSSEAVNTRCRC